MTSFKNVCLLIYKAISEMYEYYKQLNLYLRSIRFGKPSTYIIVIKYLVVAQNCMTHVIMALILN